MKNKNKKDLDIILPQPLEETQAVSKEDRLKQKKPSFLPMILGFLVLVGAAVYFLVPQKAEITILPSIEMASFEINKEVSGQFMRQEDAVLEKFYSFGTEKVENKAEGVIRVYNDYHLEQPLIVDTRFWCRGEEEMEFKTKEKVTIPAAGHLDVEVIASLPGDKFNLDSCKVFSVPGLVGTARYTHVYGELVSPTKGGESFTGVLVIEKKELERIAKEHVLMQISQAREIKEGSLGVSYSSHSANLQEGIVGLDLEITVEVYSSIDKEAFKRMVRGADENQLERLIADMPEVNKVYLKFWPFWVNRVPENLTAIDIKLDV